MRNQQDPRPSEWMRPSEVAAAFGVTARTVTDWADNGLIPSYRLPSGHRRFLRTDIEALLPKATPA